MTPRILRVGERQMPGIGAGGVAERLLFLSLKSTSTVLLQGVKSEIIGLAPRLNIVNLSKSGMTVAGGDDDISVISIFT